MPKVFSTKVILPLLVVLGAAGGAAAFFLHARTNSVPVPASPANTEERLDKLESNVNKILTLLQNQSGGASTPTSAPLSGASPAAPSPPQSPPPSQDQFLAGPVLHIFSMQTVDLYALPDGPPSTGEVGKLVDTTQLFRAGRLLEEPDLQDFANSMVGYLWSGDLVIRSGGPTLFLIESKPLWPNEPLPNEKAVLTIGGNEVAQFVGGPRATMTPTTVQVNMPPGGGIYKMQLWFVMGQRYNNLSHYSMTIKIKEQDDSSLRTITKDDFMHQK
jgi:hypothetical protein